MHRHLVGTILAASAMALAWLGAASAIGDDRPPAADRGMERPRLVVQLGHADSVTAVAFLPDGKQIATGSWDDTAALWDAASGDEIRRFAGHISKVSSVAFSPDGTRLLTGSWDTTALLWDAKIGKQIGRFEGHAREVTAAAFSPDGKQVLTGSADETARLWDAASDKKIRSFAGHTGAVTSVAFSPSGKQIVTGSEDRTARLWDTTTGNEIRRFTGHADRVTSVAFSPKENKVLTGSADGTARLWDAASGRELRRFRGHADGITSVAFSADGKQILTGSWDRTARLWEAESGKEIRRFDVHSSDVNAVAFSPDGKIVLTGASGGMANAWDARSGKEIRRFEGRSESVDSLAISADAKQLVTCGSGANSANDSTARLWDLTLGKEIRRFSGHTDRVTSVAFSPGGRQMLTGSYDHTARLWDTMLGKEIRRFEGHADRIYSVAFSPDGKQVLTGSADRTARLWDVASGKELHRLSGHTQPIFSVALSPDGSKALTGSRDGTARLWDAASGTEIRRFGSRADKITSVAFSPDGKRIVTGSAFNMARLWDVANGREIRRFDHRHTDGVRAVAFSPNGKQVLTGSLDGTARLWDAELGNEIRVFAGHSGGVASVAFSPDGKQIFTGSLDGTSRVWDAAFGNALCTLASFTNGQWAVTDAAGRFDASNGGDVDGLHWVVGNEPIDLAQLKERYYEPGLLAERLGLNPEPPRDVESFTSPKLFPAVALAPPNPNEPTLAIDLTNQGGGIGRVVVRINGKEFMADARGAGHDADARSLALRLPLPPDQPLLIPGRPNKIEVEAYNAEGYLRSRGIELEYEPPAPARSDPPRIWMVVAGVSKYRADTLQLHFAAKDAEDFATAAGIAAQRLLGASHVHLSVLTTSRGDPKQRPTRANFLAAFQAIRDGNAKSTDILVVYLAGHGVNFGGQDGDFYFLTSDAESANLSDPAVRRSVALSGREIAEQINSVPALKQVLLLDTCASGRLIEKLTEKREVPGSQIRALDRLKDRTGMFVLAGCAADSVSYEASRYGQGVLTYSLLLGMRGSALREEQFVDVDKLFGFAADEVPALARDIGGIQRPVIAVPKGGASFDIGQLTASDRQKIPLQPERPLVLRSTFEDEVAFDDVLGLGKRVDELLRNGSARGSAAAIVFVDARDMPDGYRLVGRYKTADGKTSVAAKLFRNSHVAIEFTVAGTADKPDDLAGRIVAEVEKRVAAQPSGRKP